MRTRNTVLLIIVLVILTAGVFGYLYLRQPSAPATPAEEGPNFIATIWPFGRSESSEPQETQEPVDVSGYETPSEETTPVADLKKISSMPIAGYGIFLKERYREAETEMASYVRYVDKLSGNVYQTFADNLDERKFSSTVVPKLYEALFGDNGKGVIMRYLGSDEKSIQTFSGSLPEEVLGADRQENKLEGSYLPENISGVSLSPDASKLFYLLPAGEGVAGIMMDLSTGSKTQVFDSPFTQWLPDWPNDRLISLTTKPSSGVAGYVYALDPSTKEFRKLIGKINGLTALVSPGGRLILYANNILSMNILNRDSGEAIPVGIRTLPEKCVWNETSTALYCAVPKFPSGSEYPDTWYRGEVSFSDEIWRIEPTNGNGTLLADPISVFGGEEVDAVNLKLESSEKYLFFMNKKDSYLWELTL